MLLFFLIKIMVLAFRSLAGRNGRGTDGLLVAFVLIQLILTIGERVIRLDILIIAVE